MNKQSITDRIEELLNEHQYNNLDYLLECLVKRTHGLKQLKSFTSNPEYQNLLNKSSTQNDIANSLRKSSIELLTKIEENECPSQNDLQTNI